MHAGWCFLTVTSTSPDVSRVFRLCSFLNKKQNKKKMIESSQFSLTNSFWQVWLNALHSRRDSTEILVAHSSIIWRPQAQENHFQLFTCLFTVSSRTCFLHIWKAHIACTSLSSTVPHSHCQHYWYYLSQPFDTDHMFCLLLSILFYSVIDVIRCKSGSGHCGPFCLRLQ